MSEGETPPRARLDVVTPAYNEASTIEPVLRELSAALAPLVDARIIACEDGSTDGTADVLRRLELASPLELRSFRERRGYTRALIDGLTAANAPWVLAIDSDGQIDPADFPALWSIRHGADVVIGRRARRCDPFARRALSGGFKVLYDALFQPPVDDPSCPFVLMTRASAHRLVARLGTMELAFWWEFVAQAQHLGLVLRQVTIRHRPRAAGTSRAIPLHRVPQIGAAHTLALLRLWWRLRR